MLPSHRLPLTERTDRARFRPLRAIALAACIPLLALSGSLRAQPAPGGISPTSSGSGARDSVGTLRALGEAASLGRAPGGLRAAIAYWREALLLERATRSDGYRTALLRQLGEAYDELAIGDSARAFYEAALLHTADGQDPTERASVLVAGALPVHAELMARDGGAGRIAIARARLTEAREIAERLADQALMGRVQLAQGKLRLAERDADGSARAFEAAAVTARSAGDALTEARALALLGNHVAVIRRNLDSATTLLTRARERAVDADAPRLVIEVEGRTGSLLGYLGRRDEGLAMLRSAIAAAEAADDPVSEGTWQSYLGFILLEAGEPTEAIAAWRRSNAVLEPVGAVSSVSYGNVASAFTRMGQADSAIRYHRMALDVARRQRLADQEAAAANALASLYASLQRRDSVRVYEAIAREASSRTGVPTGAELQRVASRATEALAEGDTAAALEVLGAGRRLVAASDAARESFEAESRATVLRLALELHLARGQPETAYAIGRTWEQRARGPADSLNALLWSGVALERAGRLEDALRTFENGLRRARELRDASSEQTALLLMARAHAGAALDSRNASGSDVTRLTAHARAASEFFDSVAVLAARERRSAGGSENRIGVAESGQRDATLWAAMRLVLDDSPGALAVSDRFRARDLLETARQTQGVELDDAWTGTAAEAGKELIRAVTGDDRAFLSYHLADDGLWIWIGGADGSLHHTTVTVTADSLAVLIGGVRESLAGRGTGSVAARSARLETPAFTASGLGLGRPSSGTTTGLLAVLAEILLPAEVREHLPARGEVVIVPHGVLGLVPFGALPVDTRGYPLGARHALRMAPSLAFAVGEVDGRNPDWRSSLANALVVGNPSMPRVVDADGRATTLPPLPAAEREASRVASLLRTPVLSGARASEATVRDRLATAPVVHLATHGMAYGVLERAADSYLAFAPGDGHDGRLTLAEIEGDDTLALQAELVALSACETGFGDVRFAEGTIGLQRAFLGRGARRVLVTLWSVDDAATALLMERFYTHWIRGADRPTAAESLRRAVTELRERAPQYSDPYYWAGVQLVGQP